MRIGDKNSNKPQARSKHKFENPSGVLYVLLKIEWLGSRPAKII